MRGVHKSELSILNAGSHQCMSLQTCENMNLVWVKFNLSKNNRNVIITE